MINSRYPLINAELWQVLPFLSVCLKKKKDPERENADLLPSASPRSDDGKKRNANDERLNKVISENNGSYRGSPVIKFKGKTVTENEDIFEDFGFGITSWFSLLGLLWKLYFFFSIIAIGMMYYYSINGSQFDGKDGLKFTLGNLGYSET